MKHHGQWADGFADRLIPDSTRIETWTAHLQKGSDMKNYDENWDADEDDGSEVATFLDYSDNGWWIVGLMVCENGKRPRCLRVIDQDKSINTLVDRAVYDHGLDPERLWLSSCAKEIAMLELSGMRV